MSKKYPDSWLVAARASHEAGVPLKDLPAPPPQKKRKNEEFQLQAALVAWWGGACVGFNVPEFLLWHTPNSAVYGGSKEQREKMGAMLKRLGQRSGCPDLFLAVPRDVQHNVGSEAWAVSRCPGLFLELKAPKGIVSPEQICFHAALKEQGYKVCVVRNLEDAKKEITSYLT